MEHLDSLAALLRERSAIDRQISLIINRPVHSGHFGEYVASVVLGIELRPAANEQGIDGHFSIGPLAGRTVNVKYRTRHRGLLNMKPSIDPENHPDFYLALAGPTIPMGSTGGTIAPLCINSLYLFESRPLLAELAVRGNRPGVGRSLPGAWWDAAMLFPFARSHLLRLTPEQQQALSLFAVD